jgi:hypothetical protein
MKPGRYNKSTGSLYLSAVAEGYGGDNNIEFEYEFLFFKVNARLKSGHLLYACCWLFGRIFILSKATT